MAYQTIVAVERDGLDLNILSVQFEVPDDAAFDLMTAISHAVEDFAETEDGDRILAYNSGYFNLADVVISLPREFCERHGFKILDGSRADIIIDWDYDFTEFVNKPDEEDW